MRRLLVPLALVLGSGLAQADDQSECVAGIAMLQVEVPKATGAVRTKVERELRVAQREQGEGEFDECMDAIRAARAALGK